MEILNWNDLGIAGFSAAVLWVVYKFIDKWLGKMFDAGNGWASKFYDVQAKQSEAMTVLAHRVTETSDDQRNTLIVMRSISTSLERLHTEVGTVAERDREMAERLGGVESTIAKLGQGRWIGVKDGE
jgi:hypothetical protein